MFRLMHSKKLAPPDLYPTATLAIDAGRNLYGDKELDDYVDNDTFMVQEVRQARLSDFLDIGVVVGAMRETMQDLCKRSDVLTTPEFDVIVPQLNFCLRQAMDYVEEEYFSKRKLADIEPDEIPPLTLEGCYVIQRTVTINVNPISLEDLQAEDKAQS